MAITGRTILTVAVVLTVIGTSGCASREASQSVGPGAAPPPTESRDAITEDEYEAAFFEFVDCMESEGHTVSYSRDDYLFDMSVLASAVSDGPYDSCYSVHFRDEDRAWQLANEYQSETQKILRDCLIDAGIDPGTTVDQVQDQLEANNLNIDICLGLD